MSCGRGYKRKYALVRHIKYECEKEPQFQCTYCPHKTKLKENLKKHMKNQHLAELMEHDSSTTSGT